MKVYTDKKINEIVVGLAALDAEIAALRAAADEARELLADDSPGDATALVDALARLKRAQMEMSLTV